MTIVLKNFIALCLDSITAAIASQRVKDQSKFWNFYDILYKNQEENSGWANKDNVKKFALQTGGLNTHL
jgi:protein-disulfide isomerase